MVNFVNVADIVDPKTGLTAREVNAAKQHIFSLNSLVEFTGDYIYSGTRGYIIGVTRDCDQTPLYYLGFQKAERMMNHKEVLAYVRERGLLSGVYGPVGEDSLLLISIDKG